MKPVVKEFSGDTMNAAIAANSSSVPQRFIGIFSVMYFTCASGIASTMAVRAANDAVQIHGANGMSDEFPVGRYLRDAKVTEIIEGSTQIQQIALPMFDFEEF